MRRTGPMDADFYGSVHSTRLGREGGIIVEGSTPPSSTGRVPRSAVSVLADAVALPGGCRLPDGASALRVLIAMKRRRGRRD